VDLILAVPPEAGALTAAFMVSVANIISKPALRHTPPFTGAFVFAAFGVIVMGPWILRFPPQGGDLREGFLWFFLSGIVHPGFALTFLFIGNRRVGVSRAASIASIAPLVGVIVGVMFMGQRPEATVWLGGLFIVGGIVCISGEKAKGAFERKDMIFPLLSGIALGLAPVFRKVALTHVPSPTYGVVAAGLGGMAGLALMGGIFPEGERLRLRSKGVPIFVLGALFALAGRLFYFDSLNRGDFSRVVFLVNTSPLFILVLSWVLLRKTEHITARLVGGTVAVVVGIWIMTMVGGRGS
jgi:uncharacterized membrane protein